MTWFLRLGAACLLAQSCAAVIQYNVPGNTCNTISAQGNSVFCCDGACYDGTRIGAPGGQCANFDNDCTDTTPPRCGTNQVLGSTAMTTNTTDLGVCYNLFGAGCQWQRFYYYYTCCDCPAGFVGINSHCDAVSNPNSGFCVGCNGAGEQLQYNATSQSYVCQIQASSASVSSTSVSSTSVSSTSVSSTSSVSSTASTVASSTTSSSSSSETSSTAPSSTLPTSTTASATTPTSTTVSDTTSTSNTVSNTASAPTTTASSGLCDQLEREANSLNKASSFTSWLGSICATTDVLSATATVLEDVYSLAKAITQPQTGIFGNSFGAASAVLSTISSFALGGAALAGAGEALGIGATLALNYEIACGVLTFVGFTVTAAQISNNDLIAAQCPPAITKRVVVVSSDVVSANFPRDSSNNNPCLQFLAYFPTDYSLPAVMNAACDQISANSASFAFTQNVTQKCHGYQSSGNSTLLNDFAQMLQAIRDFVPYCTTNLASVMSSSGLSQSTPAVSCSGTTTPVLSSAMTTASVVSASASVSNTPSTSISMTRQSQSGIISNMPSSTGPTSQESALGIPSATTGGAISPGSTNPTSPSGVTGATSPSSASPSIVIFSGSSPPELASCAQSLVSKATWVGLLVVAWLL